jgi:hypothetical protein
VHRVLAVKPEEKRPLVRHMRRWEDNIKMHFKEGGLTLAQDIDKWQAFVKRK